MFGIMLWNELAANLRAPGCKCRRIVPSPKLGSSRGAADMQTEANNRSVDQSKNSAGQSHAHEAPVLSVVIPVRNDAPSVQVMVPILAAVIEVPNEVLVVYDDPDDACVPVIERLRERFPTLRGIRNDVARGLLPALQAGVTAARGQYVLIYAADEIGPVLAIGRMLRLMDQGCEFVSATRYAGGGRRYGGSLLGHFLSLAGNTLFRLCSATALSDSTTGMKMFRRDVFDRLKLTGIGGGWSCAFEASIRAQLLGLKLGEVPIVSIDRLFGGESTFRPIPWILAYSKVFLWGAIQMPPWYNPRPRLAVPRVPRI
jgi:dolichol-phosphate mannosyltransferase